MPQTQQDILINAPIAKVFGVIADYERYPEFLPDMKRVEVLSRHDGLLLVRFEVELVMRVSYTLRIQEDAPRSVSWMLEEAKMLSESNGGWRLTEEGGQTRATYALDVKLRGLLPKAVSSRLLGTSLPEMLQQFKARAEAQL